MNMQVEFNWYLVAQGEPTVMSDGHWDDDGNFFETGTYFQTQKEGARIYPVGSVVPLIQDDQAVALVHIREMATRLGPKNQPFTAVHYEVVLPLVEGDPVTNHYNDMYQTYKKQQEAENHGGRFKTGEFVNALERRGFEEALKQREETT